MGGSSDKGGHAMKYRGSLAAIIAVLALLVSAVQVAGQGGGELSPHALSSYSFTYQGQLKDAAGPVNATCDLQFTLWDAASGGSQVGWGWLVEGVEIVDGLFTARLDFGGVHDGSARWLEVAVRCPAGSGGYVTLSPRQELTGSPYALYALSAPWTGLSGVPGGFADGVDNDTTYSAGAGLVLEGTEFRANRAETQWRVNETCAEGSSIRAIDVDGTVVCEPDDNTTYSAGTGLSLVGGQFSVDFAGTGSAGTASRSDHNHDATYVNEGQANSVSTGMVQNSTLLLEDLNQNGCSTGQVIKWNGSAWACAADATGGTSFWSLTGNASTTPGTNYLGTSDNVALEIRVNGARALRLEPRSSPNLLGGYSGNLLTAGVVGVTIGGGGSSALAQRVTDSYGTVSGGANNRAGDDTGTVSDASYATVGGGLGNTAQRESATIGGGAYNNVLGAYGIVAGGDHNHAFGQNSTVAGGGWNEVTGSGSYAFIGGGYENSATATYTAVVGGQYNTASHSVATVGGGYHNTASGMDSVVSGGYENTASFNGTTVSGGEFNTASGWMATIGGGQGNTASSNPNATVGGGWVNTASGFGSTVPGGVDNTAAGAHSFAAGRQAKALHDGSFVWADSHQEDFVSDANNEFLVRAYNGVKIVRGASTYSASQSALQVDQAAAAEAGWFYTMNASNPYTVLKVAKDPAAPSTFIDGVDRTSGGAETRRFHIAANGAYVAGSDFAESLPVAGDLASYEPGDVLVISLERPGGVEKCSQPYDSLVVGVYSTRPGFLGADKDGATEVGADEVPVAVLGIVPVKVTDENGPIQPGDLLTTSSTPGHAMRCEGLELCSGRTLGKALEGLPAGQHRGVIQMLVSLQ
jgi:hypothetical protein